VNTPAPGLFLEQAPRDFALFEAFSLRTPVSVTGL